LHAIFALAEHRSHRGPAAYLSRTPPSHCRLEGVAASRHMTLQPKLQSLVWLDPLSLAIFVVSLGRSL